MNRWILVAALALALALALPAAHAEQPWVPKPVPENTLSALNEYLGTYSHASFMCSIAYNMAKSLATLPEQDSETVKKSDFHGCIRENISALKTLHAKAQKTLKTTAQKAALKEHYALAVTALQGIAPLASERVIDYERRTNAEKRSVEQQKNRFEAEQ